MKKSKDRCILGSAFLVVALTTSLQAQTSKFSCSLYYGIGIEAYEQVDALPARIFDLPEDPYPITDAAYSSWLSHKLAAGAEYKIFRSLSGGVALGYTRCSSDNGWEGNPSYSTSATLELTDWRIQPMLNFDLLFNNENEALNVGAGLNLFHRRSRTTHLVESDTAGVSPLKSLVLDRRRWGMSYFFQLEWEDYFAPNFGYFISFRWFPSYRFEPTELKVEEYQLEGESARSEGTVYDPQKLSTDGSDSFLMSAIYFNIGLKYRF